jgi:hypothetical protein
MNNIKIGTKDQKKWALSILQQKIRPILVELLEARCIFFPVQRSKISKTEIFIKRRIAQ